MLTKRIIPCLDVRDDKVVKGIQFKNHEYVGSITNLAQRYSNDGADELVFYDIGASTTDSTVKKSWVSKVADVIDIPFCVAGGIKTLEDAEEILNLGADKISINTPAIENPKLITELSNEFGSQCVVIGMDIKIEDKKNYIYKKTGSEITSQSSNKLASEWVKQVQELGAGEIVINAMNKDGMRDGYSIDLLNELGDICDIPMIASGGAGHINHFIDVFKSTKVDGALAASIFHKQIYSINEVKSALLANNINIRL